MFNNRQGNIHSAPRDAQNTQNCRLQARMIDVLFVLPEAAPLTDL